jgi:hypothetical protein
MSKLTRSGVHGASSVPLIGGLVTRAPWLMDAMRTLVRIQLTKPGSGALAATLK